MRSEELKTIQTPLKEQYKKHPGSAMITLTARSRLGQGITCKLETGKAMVEAGLHPATGGNGLSACSGDMLLEALAACAGVTLNAVATAIEFALEDAAVVVEGDLDFRGTLSVDKSVPVGFKNIRIRFDLQTRESQERINSLIKLTERFCVVYQTLSTANSISVKVNNG